MKGLTEETNDIKGNEIGQNNEWISREMSGLWTGTGRWEDDQQWKGSGKWGGGLLYGNWNGCGKWELKDDQTGYWTGKGDLICNASFQYHVPFTLIIISFISILATVSIVAIYAVQFIREIGLIAMVLLITILTVLRKTNKGKWQAKGTWQDIGDFRILKLQGTWKLLHHKGVFSGEINDLKNNIRIPSNKNS
jgi:hypothetical protein